MAVKRATNRPSISPVSNDMVPRTELEELRARLQHTEEALKVLHDQYNQIRTQDSHLASNGPKPPEESFHALIQLGHDMGQTVVMLRDIDGKEGVQVFVGPIWEKITGYSGDELLGMSFFDLVKPKDKEPTIARHRKNMSGTPIHGKFALSILRKDGKEAMVEVSSAVSLSESLPTNIAFIRDITNQVDTEVKAKEYHDRFYSLAELGTATGEAMVVIQDTEEVEGKYVFVNELWPKITGYSKEELLTLSAFDLITPDQAEAARKRYRGILTGDVLPKLFEGAITHKNGARIPVELTIAPTIFHGRSSAIVQLRDISERKLMEYSLRKERDRYTFLFGNAPVPIVEMDLTRRKQFLNALKRKGITDAQDYFLKHLEEFAKFLSLGRIVSVNKAALDLWEANSIEEFDQSRRNLQTLMTVGKHPRDLHAVVRSNLDVVNGISPKGVDETIQTARGNQKRVMAYYFTAPENLGLSHAIWSAIDITDRIKVRDELIVYKNHLEELVKVRTAELETSRQKEHQLYESENTLRREVEEKNRTQVEFIRRLVHDLKTPLSPVLCASQMLLDQVQNNKLKRMAININRGATKLNNSMNDLIDIMRGEVGTFKLECKEVFLNQVLTEAIEFFSFEAERKDQTLIPDIQENLPIIWADEERLRQVIINLLENALRFTPSGGQVKVSAKNKCGELIVDVIDTGCGISTKDLNNIFEPYFTTTTVGKHDGLGLGLPLARMIVELHGGHIWAKNQPGIGTDVGFSIPAIKSPRPPNIEG